MAGSNATGRARRTSRAPSRALELDKDGDGQVVLLAGEPGIGKSRLVRTLRERLGDEPHTPLDDLLAVPDQRRARSRDRPCWSGRRGSIATTHQRAQLAKLKEYSRARATGSNDVVPLFAALLGVATDSALSGAEPDPGAAEGGDAGRPWSTSSPGLAAHQPVLALYEDVHWIDPTTLELLDRVIKRVRQPAGARC